MTCQAARALLLGLALVVPFSPARAGVAELRLWVARQIEPLDAGLTRTDLRTLRIEIGAEIRIMRFSAPPPPMSWMS